MKILDRLLGRPVKFVCQSISSIKKIDIASALVNAQNKMHYAVHGHAAAELIYEQADADKPHIG